MSRAIPRKCLIFNCDRRRGNFCCTDCDRKDTGRCQNPCLNSPERCGQVDKRSIRKEMEA